MIVLALLSFWQLPYARFLRNREPFAGLEKWQIAYLPVYAIWAALVVVVFPPLFGYR